jgi:hypothetical protein
MNLSILLLISFFFYFASSASIEDSKIQEDLIENGQVIKINVGLNEISTSNLLEKLKEQVLVKLDEAKEKVCNTIEINTESITRPNTNDGSIFGMSKFVRFFKNIFQSKSKPLCSSKNNSSNVNSNSTSLKNHDRYYFCFVFYS